MDDLSIIIASKNNRKLLEECLASIFQSTKKYSFEIIVVDNASSDGSQEMVKSKFPSVKLIENNENMGFVKASNQGLKTINARYAMLLNDDTIVKPNTFDAMVEFMDNTKEAGACGPKLLNIDGTIQHQGGVFGKKFFLSKKPTAVGFLIGACLMVRKEIIGQIGVLDENLFFYNDDLDWCIRIRKTGFKIFFLPQAEVVHYGGYSSKRVFNRRLFVEGFRGGLYFCRKHYGLAAYLIYKSLLFVGILLYLPFFILSYPFKREKFIDRLFAYFDILILSLRF
ncbi:MAG: glycosyl transferase family protein [Candidatus Saganbacteria bacterium]|uniref:Glycosyl transferase family protein n=1 Tax=Candidatus Saganbacteria bacterium TaxID=2575572 RepID=A0A833KZT9_UNCSA|nr:MAG: glycosyl transferase family protein [Candidatus Saganbacteria bacterium]